MCGGDAFGDPFPTFVKIALMHIQRVHSKREIYAIKMVYCNTYYKPESYWVAAPKGKNLLGGIPWLVEWHSPGRATGEVESAKKVPLHTSWDST